MPSSSSQSRDSVAEKELLAKLSEICAELAHGNFTEAKKLFAYTVQGQHSPNIEHLAESFGLMLVKLEAREYQLSTTLESLNHANRQLALGNRNLDQENKKLKKDIESRYKPGNIIGESSSMRTLLTQAGRAAQVDANVLILGETGAGKGLLAHKLHYDGPRARGPFVSINCAAIPATLLESELFGIEKGVASGVDARIGRFEQANGGSLFLDEIGDMPLECQAKILHIIEDRTVERIGGRKPIPVNVRIIAATHRDLPAMCEEKAFRPDLYYRLNVIRLHLPPLRERKEDIPALAQHFLLSCSGKYPVVADAFSPQAMQILLDYPWPGNIRELENEIERAALLAMNAVVAPKDLSPTLDIYSRTSVREEGEPPLLPPPFFSRCTPCAASDGGAPALPPMTGQFDPVPALPLSKPVAPTASLSLASAERRLIEQTLEQCGGNKSEVARKLGISREGLRKKLKRLGMS